MNSVKTERKPYDIAVTASLCYLSTIAGKVRVTSDGKGKDFLSGLATARIALPRYANQIDIPMAVMQQDRWCMPWTTIESAAYSFDFCVDGRAYLTRNRTGETYAFLTHREAAQWAQTHRERYDRRYHYSERDTFLFRPMGSFDQKRKAAIARQQSRVIAHMIDFVGKITQPDRATIKPPAFVRPGDLPLMEDGAVTAYWMEDLLKEAA